MRVQDLFKLSTRMFKARTSRTLLTVLGMSIGIGAIIFLVSFGYGLQKTLLDRITTSDSLLTLDVSESKSGVVSLGKDLVEKIKNLQGVSEISASSQINAQGHMDGVSADLVASGVSPSFFRLGGIKLSSGAMINDDNVNGVIVSSSMVQIFGKQNADEIIGKDLTMDFFMPAEKSTDNSQSTTSTPTNITGGNDLQPTLNKVTLDKTFKVIGVVAGDESMIYINENALTELNINKFSGMKVKCESQQVMGSIRDSILNEGLIVSSLSDTVDQANQIFSIVQLILMLFGIVALVVSAIGMFNTMTITLLERTQEIGIMKSIGASDRGVSLMFITESTIMGFLGGLCGVLIGILGGQIFNKAINLVASHFGGESVSLFYSPLWFVSGVIGFSAIVGFITGFVPARKASKIDPLDALRYK